MSKAKPKRVLVLLYPFNEEMEIDISVAVLRRGGLDVTVAGPDRNAITGSRGIKKLPEMSLREAVARGPYDAVLLTGGQDGWKALSESKEVGNLLREQERCDRLIAAICTSPIALKTHGIAFGKKLTSYPHPRVEQQVREGGHYVYMYDDVVVDGNLITSKGNFTTFHFALTLLERLSDKANARDAAAEMMIVY